MRWILAAVLILLSCLGWADKSIFSKTMYGASPVHAPNQENRTDMPIQRALLRQQDGQITMLIESVVNGDPGEYGWIVPVPEKPLYVNSVKPEYLRQAFATHRPTIENLPAMDPWDCAAMIVIGALLATSGWRYRKQPKDRKITALSLEFGIALLLVLVYPVLKSKPIPMDYMQDQAKGASAAAPSFAKSLGNFGSYAVFVLDPAKESEDGKTVTDWLRDNHFQFRPEERKVIADYSAKGWKFVAAKFRHDIGGLPPHPMKIVYPGNELTYPLRLTGQTKHPLFLEMLVVGQSTATIPGLQTMTSDSGSWTVNAYDDPGYRNDQYKDWKYREIQGANADEVTTYLRGELTPAQMQADLKLGWKPFEPQHLSLYREATFPAARLTEIANWMLGGGFLLGIVGIFRPQFTAYLVVVLLLAVVARTVIWQSGLTLVTAANEQGGYFGNPYGQIYGGPPGYMRK